MKTRSLKQYMFLGIILTTVILLLVFISYGITSVLQYRDRYLTELDLQTQARVHELADDISSMDSYISRLFSSNAQCEILKRGSVPESEWMKASYYLNNTLQSRNNTQDYFGGAFFYDAQMDMMFSNYSMLPQNISEYRLNETVKNLLRIETTENPRFRGTFTYEGDTFLICTIGNRKLSLGFLVCLSRYYELPAGVSLLAFQDGRLLFSSGESLPDEIVSAAEHGKKGSLTFISSEDTLYPQEIRLVFIEEKEELAFWKNRVFIFLFLIIPLIAFVLLSGIYRLWIHTMYEPINYVMSRLDRMKDNSHRRKKPGEEGIEEPEEMPAKPDIGDTSPVKLKEIQLINERLDELMREMEELEREKYRREGEANAARLQYYQLQVRPHFYLNCLTILDSLLNDKNIDTVRQMIYLMSSHVRYSFRDSSSMVTLEEELEEVRAYVNLYMIRNANPIFLKVSAPEEAKQCRIPILSIQPFVENSIKYALTPGTILSLELKAECIVMDSQSFLKISVSDNGKGFPENKLENLNRRVTEFQYNSTQVGVDNIKYRLHLIYGDKAVMYLYNKPSGGAVTELLIPEAEDEYSNY